MFFQTSKTKIVQNLEHSDHVKFKINITTPSRTYRLLQSPKLHIFCDQRGQSELTVTDMFKHNKTYPDVPAHVLNVQEKDHSKICSNLIDMFKIS